MSEIQDKDREAMKILKPSWHAYNFEVVMCLRTNVSTRYVVLEFG